jgi:hypothetical protein
MTGILGYGIVGREGCSVAGENALTIGESERCLLVQVEHFGNMRSGRGVVDIRVDLLQLNLVTML